MSKVLFKAVLVLLAIAALSLIGVEIYYLWTIRTPSTSQVSIPQEAPTPTPTPFVSESLDEVVSFAGYFQKWEEIPGSKDKYIFLADPQTGPKIRVGFEFSPLFGDQAGSSDATVFAVEKSGEEDEVLGYFEDFTAEEIDKLIKPGDLIEIILKKKIDKMENLKDENGNLLAHWLLIKGEE